MHSHMHVLLWMLLADSNGAAYARRQGISRLLLHYDGYGTGGPRLCNGVAIVLDGLIQYRRYKSGQAHDNFKN